MAQDGWGRQHKGSQMTIRLTPSFFVLCFLSVMLTTAALRAHSGGLNAQGCHAGSRPYHCHRAQSEMVGNRLRCELGSRSSECRGTSARNTTVQNFQNQLVQHCRNLPQRFADGVYGPATVQALIRFQNAYDITADGKYGPQTAQALSGPVTGACR